MPPAPPAPPTPPAAGYTIIIDTREQTPLTFASGIPTVRRGLATGDYSILGYEDLFTVERKSLADLVHTLIHERERFIRELRRMQSIPFRRVLCTADMAAVRRGNYKHSRANPKSVIAMIATFEVRYGVPFVFAGSTDEAARRVADWAHYFTREQRLAAAAASQTAPTPGNATPQPPPLSRYCEDPKPSFTPPAAVRNLRRFPLLQQKPQKKEV